MEWLFEAATRFCVSHGIDRTYWLALSGGLDSTVLLHIMANVRSLYPIRLRAIHVHHGLSPNADHWALHCEALCREYAIDLVQKNIDVKFSAGESPEEAARDLRYQALADMMGENDILLTAHHQDDQAETVLLQLLRGSGPKGLAAMGEFVAFQQGYLGRPLLHFSRQQLQEYAEQNHLHWINDESNSNINFTRNFMRHDVIPLLKTRWPNVCVALSRVANHCADAQALLENYTAHDLEDCHGSKPNTLSVKKLLELNSARQTQVIRSWIGKNNFTLPSTVKMKHILHDVLTAGEDKSPLVTWGEVEIRRYRDDIYIFKSTEQITGTSEEYHWDFSQTLAIPGVGDLRAESVLGQGVRADITSVIVRFRNAGDSCQLPGRDHHHSLKKLFQTWGVPPWERDQLPLIFVNNQLIAAIGYFVDPNYAARDLEMGLQFIFSCS